MAVVGLHTVFEHHDAMQPHTLDAFLHEYRITFPVGVDAAGTDGPIPKTMASYGMRGTPTLVLIDRAGRLRAHVFGSQHEDMVVGAQIATLVAETSAATSPETVDRPAASPGCSDTGCGI